MLSDSKKYYKTTDINVSGWLIAFWWHTHKFIYFIFFGQFLFFIIMNYEEISCRVYG